MALPPDREKFTGLTTSVFSSALGLNQYTTRQKLYDRMTDEDVFSGNIATEYGNAMEPYAVAAYEAHFGNLLDWTGNRQRFVMFDIGIPVGTTPDGLDPHDGCMVEFKCPYSQKIYDEDYWKLMYMPQLQGQMRAFDGEHSSRLMIWTPEEYAVWDVPYSEEYVNWMAPRLIEFWDYVTRKVRPKRKRREVPPDVNVTRIV